MKKALVTLIVVLLFATVALVLIGATNSGGGEDGDTLGFASYLSDPGGGQRGASSPPYNSEELPEADPDAWYMLLVNADNPLPADFSVNTGITADGYMFDARAIEALDALLSAGREAGMQLVLTSAYRTYDYQDGLYQNKIGRVMEETGCTRAEAEELAAKEVARPGTSEHNIGLAADIVCEYYNIMDAGYADTAEAVWLRENCAEYGFILRYDEGKEDITGIIYEPWHFRYVGVEAARYIMANDICLEEFLDLYK